MVKISFVSFERGLVALVEAVEETAVGLLTNAVALSFQEAVHSEVAELVSGWHQESVQVSSVAVVVLGLKDGLIAVINEEIDTIEVLLMGVLPEPVGGVNL